MGTNKYTAAFFIIPLFIPLPLFVSVAILVVGVSSLEEGVVTAGDQYTLQCNISRMAPIPNNTVLEVMWLDNNNDLISSGTTYTVSDISNTNAAYLSSTLTFLQLTTTQGGLYSCVVNVSIVIGQQIINTFPVQVSSESSTGCMGLNFLSSCVIDITFPPNSSKFFKYISHLSTGQGGYPLCWNVSELGVLGCSHS